jgi:FAD/FMN-containing dehydrogenase
MPAVVPQLKSITIGGAAAGVGIEATSFRYGLVHETLQELEILLPDGRVVLVTPDNDYRDLFYGFPNSYGTLGYALKLRALAVPVKPFVAVRHTHFEDPEAFFAAIEAGCGGDADFVDGVVFGPNERVLSEARFVDEAPWTSDYTYQNIYYRSLRQRDSDYLTTSDYIWRWDTDWFWCSKNLGAQNRLIRRLLGRERLNSVFYTKMMRWNSKWGLTRHLDRLLGRHRESVIQDVDIPLRNAPAFLDFFQREIGILPIWICPIRPYRKDARFTLFPMDPDTLYLNFGFWDVVRCRQAFAPGHHNRLVEAKVAALGGIKSLYSDSYYEPEEFWRIYDGEAYRALKSKYDPQGRARDLYQKCVLRQ